MTQQEIEQLTNNTKMLAKDSISAKLAQCFITLNGNRYNFMSMTKFEAKFKKNKKKVAILGKTGAGNKATGWEGTFSATMHYNTSVMRELMEQFKDTGEDAEFLRNLTRRQRIRWMKMSVVHLKISKSRENLRCLMVCWINE